MEFWHGFILITTVHLLAAASPGPDFILVTQQTLTKNRKTGLLCSLGITIGLGVHVVYSVFGLAAIIAHSQPLLTAIKWLGGGYLIYLGWQGINAKKKPASDTSLTSASTAQINQQDTDSDNTDAGSTDSNNTDIAQTTALKIDSDSDSNSGSESAFATIRRGFFCNVFNPKAPVYFVAIFTLVLSPDMPFWQLAIYGLWMMVLQMAWFSTVVMLLSIPAIHRRFLSIEHWINRVLGTAMIGLGLNLIFRSR